jgi:hypothetical protein
MGDSGVEDGDGNGTGEPNADAEVTAATGD